MTQAGQRLRPPQRIRGVFYGWRLVVIAGCVSCISSVPLFHALSVWSVALERHFGWSRTELSIAFVFTRVEEGVMGPVEGYLTDRLGSRRMVLMGMLVLGSGFLLYGRVQNLWMFYSVFIVMAVGHGLTGWIPMMTALNNWFNRQRGKAMGWASTGQRIGALFLVPAIAWSIDPDADRFGWRMTATAIGVFILIIALPISATIRNRPEDYGQLPDGDLATPPPLAAGSGGASPQPLGVEESDFTVRQAIRTPAFWLISWGHAFNSILITTVIFHLALMLTDQGVSLQTAAWVIAVYTATAMVFQVVGGYIGDRVPKNVTIFAFSTILSGSVLSITLAHSVPMAFLFAVTFGIGFGGRSAVTVAIRGDYFGRKAFAKILGVSQLPVNICLLAGPLLAGIYRDHWGSYSVPFNIFAVFCLLGGILFLMAKKPALSTYANRA